MGEVSDEQGEHCNEHDVEDGELFRRVMTAREGRDLSNLPDGLFHHVSRLFWCATMQEGAVPLAGISNLMACFKDGFLDKLRVSTKCIFEVIVSKEGCSEYLKLGLWEDLLESKAQLPYWCS